MGMATDSEFHVLAVDDSIIDRKLIEKLLKTSSYQVTTVDSGSKALEFLGFCKDEESNPNQPLVSPKNQQEVEVNLVITDYCMPEMTGYDLLRKIKESSSLKNIPVVIMSSENVPSRISRCLQEGAEEFFLKPVKISDVNKLRPHMMKSKQFQNHQDSEKQENQERPQLQQDSKQEKEDPQQEEQQSNNNKRKAMEEGLSPDRRRPRFSGLTVVSN